MRIFFSLAYTGIINHIFSLYLKQNDNFFVLKGILHGYFTQKFLDCLRKIDKLLENYCKRMIFSFENFMP